MTHGQTAANAKLPQPSTRPCRDSVFLGSCDSRPARYTARPQGRDGFRSFDPGMHREPGGRRVSVSGPHDRHPFPAASGCHHLRRRRSYSVLGLEAVNLGGREPAFAVMQPSHSSHWPLQPAARRSSWKTSTARQCCQIPEASLASTSRVARPETGGLGRRRDLTDCLLFKPERHEMVAHQVTARRRIA